MASSVMAVLAAVMLPLREQVVKVMTTDLPVDRLTARVLGAFFVGTYLSMLIQIATGGVLTGQVRGNRAYILYSTILTCPI